MQVVDAHHHLGICRVFGLNVAEDAIVAALDRHGIDTALVQPFPGGADPAGVHDRIAALARRYPGRVFGIVSRNPHQERAAWTREVERCVGDLGFVGIKLPSTGHAVNPLSHDGAASFAVAQRWRIPVMVHTGMGIPLVAPSLVGPRAEQCPDVTSVLAHTGCGITSCEVVLAAQRYPNIHVETS
jgi:predicted TIM-barrel fold metal-dependent hydrolase